MRRPVARLSFEDLVAMQDFLWIAAMLGLLALTLAYVRLCDHA
ncbi:hypothetical protein [Sphingomonas oryzagri]|uniref:Uncharacterized protein n=1 Tax=Sphingomonas oryzagri TaxID=3042314 RepID=A0ABT6N5I1_9SPHN|nr:hypothetical protein [Sphingomonas oryzagri]MDH7640358.1 hypothetical protein [Sphingomonas oryzagri]